MKNTCTICGFELDSRGGLRFMGDSPLCRDCFADQYAQQRNEAWRQELEDEGEEPTDEDCEAAYVGHLSEGYVEAELILG